jgi:hypothetical protein
MRTRKVGLAMLVAVLALTLAAAPASAVSKPEKKQNKALKTLNKRTKATNKRLKRFSTNLGKLAADVKNAKDGLTAIQVAVPTVISSLTQLKTGLETAGAGLTKLSGAFSKQVNGVEYGVVQLYFDPEGDGFEANDAQPGQLLTTADVPDDANQSTMTGKLFFSIPNGTTAKEIALKAGMRSGEKDRTAAGGPVGEAGLMAMTVSVIGATTTTSAGGGNPGAPTSLPLTSKPNAAFGGAPVYAIPTGAERSDATPNPLSFPNNLMIELTDPTRLQTLTAPPGRFTVTNTSGGPASGIVDVTVRFHDFTPVDADNLDE